MISIRNSMFETNSSSAHTFILPSDSKNLKIPKYIKLDGRFRDTTEQIDRINFMYRLADDYGYGDIFIRYLESKGIKVELSNTEDFVEQMCSYFSISKDDLDNVCFNTDIISEDNYEEYNTKLMNDPNYKIIAIRE